MNSDDRRSDAMEIEQRVAIIPGPFMSSMLIFPGYSPPLSDIKLAACRVHGQASRDTEQNRGLLPPAVSPCLISRKRDAACCISTDYYAVFGTEYLNYTLYLRPETPGSFNSTTSSRVTRLRDLRITKQNLGTDITPSSPSFHLPVSFSHRPSRPLVLSSSRPVSRSPPSFLAFPLIRKFRAQVLAV